MTNTNRIDESSEPTESDGHVGPVVLPIRRRWLFLFAVFFLAPWAVLVWHLFGHNPPTNDHTVRDKKIVGQSAQGEHRCRPGPWGDLYFEHISLTPPAEFIVHLVPGLIGNDWHFPDTTEDELRRFFRNVDVTDTVRQRLLNAVRPAPTISGFIIARDEQLVRSLSPRARAQIYFHLGQHQTNFDQLGAFRFAGDSLDLWLGNSSLPASTIERIRPLVYRNRSFLYFADLPLVLSPSASRAERIQVVGALARQRSLIVRLFVRPDADIEALVKYWGRGGREAQVRPLIESLANLPGGGSIDISFLLPPFARDHFHIYPKVLRDGLGTQRDCHWTAFNFFNDRPDDQYTSFKNVSQLVRSGFQLVEDEPRLGDILCYGQEGGRWIHSAVYIADDIVYTKNGSQASNPWMLMTRAAMFDYYPAPRPLDVWILRRVER